MKEVLKKIKVSDEVMDVLINCKSLGVPKTREELFDLAMGHEQINVFDVEYDVPGMGRKLEATVTRSTNGLVVCYLEDYMRRRDPNCMVIGDNKPTDKPRYKDSFKGDFKKTRKNTLAWLKEQDLLLIPFMAGGEEYGYEALAIVPKNAAFFALALADIQKFIHSDKMDAGFEPRAIVFVAPPFRHMLFEGKQVVVHNRAEVHEVFSYNLYPGPSAKKGIYSVLLNIGEEENWVTCHASAVKVITPYDNELVIMHEGASGGGKSEMLEPIHREFDQRIVMARNTLTGEKTYIDLTETCELKPITDDMALNNRKMQGENTKLVIRDAEEAWFLRVDHITEYGIAPELEKNIIQPKKPLLFFNLHGAPNATCLPWEHAIDSTGQPCPNPRVVLPREMMKNIITENVEVDVRSFGVRTPPSTKNAPNYGIIGLMQVLPPALAWIWRLVAPRGYNNPSIIDSVGMSAEGVGSYWPFATGQKVTQANLLLTQIIESPDTRYVLIPNQHIGAFEVGFMPQWISREYIARRGGVHFRADQLVDARCSLLGYSLETLKIDGQYVRRKFLRPELQNELGLEAYDLGAKMLVDFFKVELAQFNVEGLNPLGKEIIECFMNDGKVEDYLKFIPMNF